MRPKLKSGKDENHFVVRDFLRDRCGGFQVSPKKDEDGHPVCGSSVGYTANYRGYKVCAIDTSKHGGLLTDWILTVDGISVFVEVKTDEARGKEGRSLTPGERWTDYACGVYVVVTEEDVERVVETLVVAVHRQRRLP